MKHPSYCCQKFGECIGWMGRFMFPFIHKCRHKQQKTMSTSYTPTPTAIRYETPKGEPLMTIHLDGRMIVSDTLKPTETARQVLDMMRQYWMSDIQATEIRGLQERIKKLEDHIDLLEQCGNSFFYGLTRDNAMERWNKAKESKP